MPKTYADFVREAKQRIREVSVEEARARFDANAGCVFLDVREGEETIRGTIPGAVCVPRGILEGHAPDWFPSADVEIVCYCAGGNRSALAVDVLQQMGFANVVNMAGGYKAWATAGNPVGRPTL